MNILITGGTGFIGSHLVHNFHKMKHNIILLKRRSSNVWRIRKIINDFTTYDIDNFEDLEKIFIENKIETIIHLATKYYKFHENLVQIKEMNETNITYPSILLHLAVKHGAKAFINTGTCFEYKLTRKKTSEDTKVEAYNYYASTKLAFEEILKFYSSHYDLRAMTLKLFFPYGEKDNKKVIPLIIQSFINGQSLNLTKGEQKLNFTYVADIVEAYLRAIEFINSNKYSHYVQFNIGTDKPYSLKQIVNVVAEISEKPNKIKLGAVPYPENEIMYFTCDYSKAKRILNWQPKTDIVKGISKTYEHYLKNPL